MEWWLGEATSQSASIVVRSTVAGGITGTTKTQTVVQQADPAIRDGLVRLDFSVVAETPVQVTGPDGSEFSATLRPLPAIGGCIAWGGCLNANRDFPSQLLEKAQVDVFVGLGDMPYAEGSGDNFGVETDGCNRSLANALDPVCYARHQLKSRLNLGLRKFGRHRAVYLTPDDHDFAVNNLQMTRTAFQQGLDFDLVEPWEPDGRLQADEIVQAGAEGLSWYYQGNPQNTDPDVDPGAFYHRFHCGDIEVFVLSCCVSGQGPGLVRRPQSGSMLGSKQKQWLLDRLAASTSTFKIILSPKQTLFATNSNNDSWRGNWGTDRNYSAEFREIADFIQAGSGWTVPGGVCWGSSDWHSPGVYASRSGTDGATADHVCVNTVLGMDTGGIRDSGPYSPYTVWAVNDPSLVSPAVEGSRFWGFGMARAQGDELQLSYVSKFDDEPLWQGVVRAGENTLHLDTPTGRER